MGKRGPQPGSGLTPNFNVRLPSELRERLEASAAGKNRPLSREIIIRLERSLRDERYIEDQYGSNENFRVANIIGLALDAVRSKLGNKDWLRDRTAFDIALHAIVGVLEAAQPPARLDEPPLQGGTANYREGREIARATWRSIVEARENRTADRLANIADDLGDVVDRPTVYRAEFEARAYARLEKLLVDAGLPHKRPTSAAEAAAIEWTDLDHTKWLQRRGKLLVEAERQVAEEMIAEGKDPRIDREDTF